MNTQICLNLFTNVHLNFHLIVHCPVLFSLSFKFPSNHDLQVATLSLLFLATPVLLRERYHVTFTRSNV